MVLFNGCKKEVTIDYECPGGKALEGFPNHSGKTLYKTNLGEEAIIDFTFTYISDPYTYQCHIVEQKFTSPVVSCGANCIQQAICSGYAVMMNSADTSEAIIKAEFNNGGNGSISRDGRNVLVSIFNTGAYLKVNPVSVRKPHQDSIITSIVFDGQQYQNVLLHSRVNHGTNELQFELYYHDEYGIIAFKLSENDPLFYREHN